MPREMVSGARSRLLLAIALALVATATAAARFRYAADTVTFLLPPSLQYEKGRYLGFALERAVVEDDGRGWVRVVGAGQTAGALPYPRECTARGPWVHRKQHDRTVLEVTCGQEGIMQFFVLTPDLAAAELIFDRFVAPGPPSGAAARGAVDRALSAASGAVFAGDLAAVADDRRLDVMRALVAARAVAAGRTTYRDLPYLEVDLGPHDEVYNTVQLNRTQRVARVTAERLIPAARRLEESLAGVDKLAGVALDIGVAYRNFVNPGNGEAGLDLVELFSPRTELARLVRDQVTSQQLLAASVVRVNGNRVDVDLSQQ